MCIRDSSLAQRSTVRRRVVYAMRQQIAAERRQENQTLGGYDRSLALSFSFGGYYQALKLAQLTQRFRQMTADLLIESRTDTTATLTPESCAFGLNHRITTGRTHPELHKACDRCTSYKRGPPHL